jgi:hypothetical protein
VVQTRHGPVVLVRVKPNARTDEVLAVDARGVRIAVRATPERGKANVAVCAVLARALRLPAGAVEVVAGASTRDKRVAVRGLDVAEIRARLGLLNG